MNQKLKDRIMKIVAEFLEDKEDNFVISLADLLTLINSHLPPLYKITIQQLSRSFHRKFSSKYQIYREVVRSPRFRTYLFRRVK